MPRVSPRTDGCDRCPVPRRPSCFKPLTGVADQRGTVQHHTQVEPQGAILQVGGTRAASGGQGTCQPTDACPQPCCFRARSAATAAESPPVRHLPSCFRARSAATAAGPPTHPPARSWLPACGRWRVPQFHQPGGAGTACGRECRGVSLVNQAPKSLGAQLGSVDLSSKSTNCCCVLTRGAECARPRHPARPAAPPSGGAQ